MKKEVAVKAKPKLNTKTKKAKSPAGFEDFLSRAFEDQKDQKKGKK